MKNIIAVAAVLAVSAVSANAADLAARPYTKAPAMVEAAAYNWSGFYAGVNAGGAFDDTRETVSPTGLFLTEPFAPSNPLRTDTSTFDRAHFTGGGQIGYNWQTDRWVFGIEADANYLDGRSTVSTNRVLAAPLVGSFIHSETVRMEWFGTVRGRVGMAVSPGFMLYGTGGLAYGRVRSSTNLLFTSAGDGYSGSADSTRTGWTAGGGGEWKFSNQWSVKAEYLYVDLGRIGYSNACSTLACAAFVPAPSYNTDLRVREHVARIGLNYTFGGPVVARY